jgi:hypothetical protein
MLLLNDVRKVHETLGKVQLVVIVEILDVLLDRVRGNGHASFTSILLRLGVLPLLGEGLQFFHSHVEAHLTLLHVSASELALLELLVDPVGLFIFKVEELLIDECGVKTCPACLHGTILKHIVKVFDFHVIRVFS